MIILAETETTIQAATKALIHLPTVLPKPARDKIWVISLAAGIAVTRSKVVAPDKMVLKTRAPILAMAEMKDSSADKAALVLTGIAEIMDGENPMPWAVTMAMAPASMDKAWAAHGAKTKTMGNKATATWAAAISKGKAVTKIEVTRAIASIISTKARTLTGLTKTDICKGSKVVLRPGVLIIWAAPTSRAAQETKGSPAGMTKTLAIAKQEQHHPIPANRNIKTNFLTKILITCKTTEIIKTETTVILTATEITEMKDTVATEMMIVTLAAA